MSRIRDLCERNNRQEMTESCSQGDLVIFYSCYLFFLLLTNANFHPCSNCKLVHNTVGPEGY